MQTVTSPNKKVKKGLIILSTTLAGICMCLIALGIYGNSLPDIPTPTIDAAAIQTQVFATAMAGMPLTQTSSANFSVIQTQAFETVWASMATSTPKPTLTPVIDDSVKAIMDGTGLNEADAQKAFEVIKSVGFERVDEIKLTSDGGATKAYRADLGYTSTFVIIFEGNEISEIYYGDITLYDKRKGGVLDQITNYVLNDDERGTFIYLAQEYVKAALKAPSTAKFPSVLWELDQWRLGREKDIVWVQSWVDAQNSFGAMLRNKFTVQISYSTQQLLYLELNGTAVFGSPQTP